MSLNSFWVILIRGQGKCLAHIEHGEKDLEKTVIEKEGEEIEKGEEKARKEDGEVVHIKSLIALRRRMRQEREEIDSRPDSYSASTILIQM